MSSNRIWVLKSVDKDGNVLAVRKVYAEELKPWTGDPEKGQGVLKIDFNPFKDGPTIEWANTAQRNSKHDHWEWHRPEPAPGFE